MCKVQKELIFGKKRRQSKSYKPACQCIIRKDVAKLLGVTPRAFDHLTRSGKLKFSRCLIGKRMQGYSHAELVYFLKKFKIVQKNGRYSVVPNTFKTFKLF